MMSELSITAGSRFAKKENVYVVVTAVKAEQQYATLVGVSWFHSYTGEFHRVDVWQDITDEEFSKMCGGHPEWFRRVIK